MAWFLNKYHHKECDTSWEDEHSCMCNDECPKCTAEIEPEESDDRTVIVSKVLKSESGSGQFEYRVRVSSALAEYDPKYFTAKICDSRDEADTVAQQLREIL